MRGKRRYLIFLVLAAMLLAACGGKGAQGPEGDGGSASNANTLIRAVNYGDPGTLDPLAKGDIAARMVTMQIFDTLVKYDAVAKQIQKSVAEEYTVSPDGLTYTFRLKKGVKFHNGREVKAEDVKYSMERTIDPQSASVLTTVFDAVEGSLEFRNGQADGISGVEVKGDNEVVIRLKETKPTFLMDLAGAAGSIYPKEEVEKAGADFGQKPVGSGPFVYESWKKDESIVLKAFDQYHGGRPKLDGVVFRFMKEEQTRDAEFQAGTIDMQVLGEALYKKYAADPVRQKDLVEVPELFTRAIHFNLTKPPFDNVKVRQAINYAVDKQAIIEKVLSNKAFVATGVLPNSANAFNPSLKGYNYDPEKARQLLKEAGFEQGFEFEVLTSASTTKWMEAINTYLNPLGINGKIVQLELGTALERARNGDYHAVFYSTGGDTDSLGFLTARFHSKNWGKAGNVTFYKNEQVDQLLDEAARTLEEAKRIQLIQQAEQTIVDETPWFIFNYNKAVMIAQPWVQGLQPVPTDVDFQDLTQVTLSERQ